MLGKIKKTNLWGFTLIEIIVAVTIFSIIMTSVIMIFVNTTNLSMRIDVDRILQENSKNIIEIISEDLKKQDIKVCDLWIIQGCIWLSNIMTWSELWVWDNHYYLAKESTLWGTFIKVTDLIDCNTKQCYIVKNWELLSNSYVNIKNLEFSIFSEHNSKVQINVLMYPMSWKWIKSSLIEKSKLNIQTTLNDDYIK